MDWTRPGTAAAHAQQLMTQRAQLKYATCTVAYIKFLFYICESAKTKSSWHLSPVRIISMALEPLSASHARQDTELNFWLQNTSVQQTSVQHSYARLMLCYAAAIAEFCITFIGKQLLCLDALPQVCQVCMQHL